MLRYALKLAAFKQRMNQRSPKHIQRPAFAYMHVRVRVRMCVCVCVQAFVYGHMLVGDGKAVCKCHRKWNWNRLTMRAIFRLASSNSASKRDRQTTRDRERYCEKLCHSAGAPETSERRGTCRAYLAVDLQWFIYFFFSVLMTTCASQPARQRSQVSGLRVYSIAIVSGYCH